MPSHAEFPIEGGCVCGNVRYRMETAPIFVHCCHCRWCQRESGSAFALNAFLEFDRVSHLKEEPELILIPSESGAGQKMARCRNCKIAVWSNYCAGGGPFLRSIRVGTLDLPDQITPDIHIYVATKQPWVILPQGTPAVEEFYKMEEFWPADSLERFKVLKPQIEAYHRGQQAG